MENSTRFARHPCLPVPRGSGSRRTSATPCTTAAALEESAVTPTHGTYPSGTCFSRVTRRFLRAPAAGALHSGSTRGPHPERDPSCAPSALSGQPGRLGLPKREEVCVLPGAAPSRRRQWSCLTIVTHSHAVSPRDSLFPHPQPAWATPSPTGEQPPAALKSGHVTRTRRAARPYVSFWLFLQPETSTGRWEYGNNT